MRRGALPVRLLLAFFGVLFAATGSPGMTVLIMLFVLIDDDSVWAPLPRWPGRALARWR